MVLLYAYAYRELTESGCLYDAIASAIGEPQKKIVKLALVKWLCGPWFDVDPFMKPSVVLKPKELKLHNVLKAAHAWLLAKFPDICNYMKSEKTNEAYRKIFSTKARHRDGRSTQPYAIIADKLQKLESRIVIETCCKTLFEIDPDFPVLTVHDGLILPISFGSIAVEALKKSFSDYGLNPKLTLSTRKYNKDENNTDITAIGERDNIVTTGYKPVTFCVS